MSKPGSCKHCESKSKKPCRKCHSDSRSLCIAQCTREDFDRALAVSNEVDANINLTTQDPVGSARRFANLHAKNGVFSIAYSDAIGPYLEIANTYGRENIYNFFVGYTTNPGEVGVTVALEKAYWDCLKRALFVERSWKATLSPNPRTYVYGPPGETNVLAALPAGATYFQDDGILYQFNCDYELVSNHEYYDSTQYNSTFVEYVPPEESHKRNDRRERNGCNLPVKCTSSDRDKATEIWRKLFFAFNMLSLPYDKNLGIDLIVDLFAEDGIYSTAPLIFPFPPPAQSNFVGRAEIRNYLTQYFTTGLGSFDKQHNVVEKNVFWDCCERTLGVQFTWVGILARPRTFWSPPVVYGEDFEYSQDNLAIITLNSKFEIVYFRSYFSQSQWKSSFPRYIAPVCTVACGPCKK